MNFRDVTKLDLLNTYRKEIDECDKELVAYFEKRLALERQRVDCKIETNFEEINQKMKNHDFQEELEKFHKRVIEISKKATKKHIVFIGFMGCGKSTIGKVLSEKLNMPWIDTDEYIEKKVGMKIPTIFSVHGEKYFRALEKNSIKEIMKQKPSIISCGGGVVLNEENVINLKNNGKIIWLKADPSTIYERIKKDDSRPLLRGNMTEEYISEMLHKRMNYYKQACDYEIDTKSEEIEDIITKIRDLLLF
ncbi:AAA family ATPase [Lutibacter sp. B2]|nr:AAA family ATPase [Lutibacter sp. B2]